MVCIAIDLKSFYASVECVERKLDPLTANLVVADASRTDKTICLAVSPSLKSFGIPGRPRLFQVVQRVREINAERRHLAPGHRFTGSSIELPELQADPSLELDYLVAPPRMATYMAYSTRIYGIYLQHVAPEDIFAYSIDEVFIDATAYLNTYHLTPHGFAMRLIRQVLQETGITATAGIGTNLFLAKVAMDVVAKHVEADADGVRIAELDERSFREQLWDHRPLTDFWRIGPGIARKLEQNGMRTLGEVCRSSTTEDGMRWLHKLFGVNAELIIDHAWGYEPTTLADVKAYEPETHSLSSGQVLMRPYAYEETRLIVMEMTDLLVLDLVDKGLVAQSITITLVHDRVNLEDEDRRRRYHGETVHDRYGRLIPKPVHGTERFGRITSSTRLIMEAAKRLFQRIANPDLLVRHVVICLDDVVPAAAEKEVYEQLTLFPDPEKEAEDAFLEKERRLQQATISIRNKFGKNAILKGMNLQDGAMTINRNAQIGGHHE